MSIAKYASRRAGRPAGMVLVACAALAVVPAALAAEPPNDEVRALTQPTNSFELGAGYVDSGSFKFGEYNGLEKRGAYALGGFDLRGGKGYDSGSGSGLRWRLNAADLGLKTRTFGAEVGDQGKYRLNYTYDEIVRNYSDQYRTPYQGTGTTGLTLPGYPAVRLSATTTAAGALSNWTNLQAPYATIVGVTPTGSGPGVLIPQMMHNFDVDTLRKRQGLDFTVGITRKWEFTTSAKHEDKDGTKLTGVAFGGPARGALLPEVIHNSTDQLRATLGYVNDKSNLAFGYYGSFFKNSIGTWTVANPFQSTLLNSFFNDAARLSGAPDNQMHRLSISGGYNFSRTTRFVASAHYSRMTQNVPFAGPWPSTWNIPVPSASAKVVNTNVNATLTARPANGLSLLANYKYEDRDNKTPVQEFLYAGGNAAGNPSLFENEPLNRRMHQFDAEGTYSFARRQAVKLAYEWQQIERSADSPESPFRADRTAEHTLRVDYRNSMSQYVSGRFGYAYSQRRSSEYEESQLIAPVNPAPLPAADPLLPGLEQFFIADRNRHKLRSALNIQPTEALSLQTGFDYNRDRYPASRYGLQYADSWVFKLDGAYARSETLSFNAFYTYESRQSRLESLAIARATTATILDPRVSGACTGFNIAAGHQPSDEGTDPCRQWSETQSDRVHTFGLNFTATELVHSKVDLNGEIAYSRARTPIDMTGGAYFSNGGAAGAPPVPNNNIWIAATSFPAISSEMLDLRLSARYTLSQRSAVRLSYLYRKLNSADWQYDAYTNSRLGAIAIPTYIGTGMTSPNYTVQVVGLSYVHSFR